MSTIFIYYSSVQHKLQILSAAAKYDVSCSSSGSKRATPREGLGNCAASGICHSFTEDGRCISLLKILLSNVCAYDCAYCINRRSNDIPRATFKVQEVVELTLEFYRRNFIEGLFLSSGVLRSPDYTMEALVRVARSLRVDHRFGGYIHLKAIPGASPELVALAGIYADRLSVNMELPSDASLRHLAPEKSFPAAFQPMSQIRDLIRSHPLLPRRRVAPPRFAPAGQTTQMIIGASPESDFQILHLASHLYQQQGLKRVYFSGYIPINTDRRLPALTTPPLGRKHRLYQADWLMRFYHFRFDEIVDPIHPDLEKDLDPKVTWALRHPEFFPLDLNRAEYEMILRVPGIGVHSARLILQGRKFGTVRLEHLKRIGVALKRARYFIFDPDMPRQVQNLYPEQIRNRLLPPPSVQQMNLFANPSLPQITHG
ncbi:MAG TPA: putative DNA modification/repair radical SAM protein [Fibrobacteraceae bacterium]|nr:putative DNA modification/repair radical SAM protein [Fibrobacteraceae bacterium]